MYSILRGPAVSDLFLDGPTTKASYVAETEKKWAFPWIDVNYTGGILS